MRCIRQFQFGNERCIVAAEGYARHGSNVKMSFGDRQYRQTGKVTYHRIQPASAITCHSRLYLRLHEKRGVNRLLNSDWLIRWLIPSMSAIPVLINTFV